MYFKQHRDNEFLDQVLIMTPGRFNLHIETVIRWKESELSGDEFRVNTATSYVARYMKDYDEQYGQEVYIEGSGRNNINASLQFLYYDLFSNHWCSEKQREFLYENFFNEEFSYASFMRKGRTMFTVSSDDVINTIAPAQLQRENGNILSLGNVIPQLYSLSRVIGEMIGYPDDYDPNEYCFQPGCHHKATKTFQIKQQYDRDGNKIDDCSLGKMHRRFCDKHSHRGDCSLEDCDSNYTLLV